MTAKYSEWTRGQDEALLNKLGGLDVARVSCWAVVRSP